MEYQAHRERILTADEYAELPDDGWCTELLRGRVVREPTPGFEHGRLQIALGEQLGRHLREFAPDLVCTGPFGVITGEKPDTVRGPDLAVLRKDRLEGLRSSGFLVGSPEIAIEIVSPWTRASQVQAKVLEYLGSGAGLVWVIYPDTRTIVVHESSGEARSLGVGDTLTGSALLPHLRIDVAGLFGG